MLTSIHLHLHLHCQMWFLSLLFHHSGCYCKLLCIFLLSNTFFVFLPVLTAKSLFPRHWLTLFLIFATFLVCSRRSSLSLILHHLPLLKYISSHMSPSQTLTGIPRKDQVSFVFLLEQPCSCHPASFFDFVLSHSLSHLNTFRSISSATPHAHYNLTYDVLEEP